MQLGELAEKLGGRAVEGDPTTEVSGVATLAEGSERDLGFVRSPRYAAALAAARIGAVIAPPGVDVAGRPVIRSETPNLDFARAAGWIRPVARPSPGIDASAVVAPSARIDPSAHVGPLCSLGAGASVGAGAVLRARVSLGEGVQVGERCELHPGVVVREGCRIGARVILQPGVVIGGDGFGYEFNERGELEKVPQVGNVIIEDDVEIGANTTVDRARLGSTVIGRGSKIDNLCQIAHNVVIGPHSVVVAQSGIAGSTRLGERVVFMAQSGAAGHLEIGAGSFVGARGGVIEDLPERSRVFGFPAVPERAWHRANALLLRLSELVKRLRALEREVGLRGGAPPARTAPDRPRD